MDEEDVLTRHRQEKKDLQAHITGLKKSIPKNDKKRRKEVIDEISKLEKEMKERHEKEMDELHQACFGNTNQEEASVDQLLVASNGLINGQNTNGKADGDDVPPIESLKIDDDENKEFRLKYEVRGISKAQRKRDRKAQLEKEKRERIETESEILYQNSAKKLEADKFKTILDGQGLTLFDIPSDGDCLFKAIEHQLSLQGKKLIVPELRKRCSDELRQRRDEFLPFLINPDTEEIMDEEQYAKYCDKIEKTKCWGGNIELQALSYALNLPIRVIQATGPSVDIGYDKFESAQPLLLSYHRHAFQLGEHYNSVIPA